jgi:hypothetical protein
MAPETVLVGRSGLIQNSPYGVRLMTVDAGRYHIRLLTPQAALYHLAMYLLDLRVALLAGLTDVVAVNAGRRMGVWQDLVRCMTRRTDRCHGQSLTEQTFTMYGKRVVLKDAVLMNVVGAGNGRSLPMAFTAQ